MKTKPTVVKKLKSIHFLTKRKADMEMKRAGARLKPSSASLGSKDSKGNYNIFDQLSSIVKLMDTLDLRIM